MKNKPKQSLNKWEVLKKILKLELSRLEEELYLLEDLKLKERKLGQWEESFHYHRQLGKVLTVMRRLEGKK